MRSDWNTGVSICWSEDGSTGAVNAVDAANVIIPRSNPAFQPHYPRGGL